MKQISEMSVSEVLEMTVTVPYEEREGDDFRDPTSYYILNAMLDGVYFKTRNRIKAQEMADKIYGKGKFVVRKAIKAAIR